MVLFLIVLLIAGGIFFVFPRVDQCAETAKDAETIALFEAAHPRRRGEFPRLGAGVIRRSVQEAPADRGMKILVLP